MIKEFIEQYGLGILYTIIMAIAGFIGAKIKNLYEEKMTDKTKRDVVETCVKAVEQMYNDLSGAEKLERAKANIVMMLNQKGIDITELELDMLIEAVVAGFNLNGLKIGGDTDDIPSVGIEIQGEID